MLGSNAFDVRVVDERQLLLAGRRTDLLVPSGEVTVKAPIPGVVVRVLVSEGEKVELNQPVLILEAMKMENELRAPRAGSVKAINVQAGEQVDQGAPLLILH
ncbi:MAG: acetyl-CoA carboxylase biotin carboxyl carrier protein subunit [Chloroflexi bacterium]|nr:acetyl-CoA carboxylase biotin carboxyl carrier protein subunit [Chloroflexota bacterium]